MFSPNAIFVRAPSLQKAPGDAASYAVWNENKDHVTGEYRGSQMIERYIDPNDRRLPDYASPLVSAPIGQFYKTRVLATKRFAP